MRLTSLCVITVLFSTSLCIFSSSRTASADDLPQWGVPWTRNMVSAEKNLPADFEPGRRPSRTGETDLAETKNVRWAQSIGGVGYGTPIIAEGKVLVGTDNARERDPRMTGDRGVLMCFDEKNGEYQWQLNVPKMTEFRATDDPDLKKEYRFADWSRVGICSPPTVENGVAYLVTNCCEVVCLDLDGMADGNDGPYKAEGQHMAGAYADPLEVTAKDADIIWVYDIMKELDVQPHNGSNCSILLDGNLLYVCTSNGIDSGHTYVPKPDAPTSIVLDKQSGKLIARDDFGTGPDIVHGQWSAPAMAEVDGCKLVFQGAGNGYLYAFEALDPQTRADGTVRTLKNVWKFNGHPLAQTQDNVPMDHQHDTSSYLITANPVYYNNKLYVVPTQELFHNIPDGWLVCLNPMLEGDITRTGILWSYDGISSSSSTPAIADGLLYIADFKGFLHCLDAESGELLWKQDIGGPIWGSPLVADGKVYIGTGRRKLHVFEHARECLPLSEITLPDKMLVPPVAANGTLYVETMSQIFAVEEQPAK